MCFLKKFSSTKTTREMETLGPCAADARWVVYPPPYKNNNNKSNDYLQGLIYKTRTFGLEGKLAGFVFLGGEVGTDMIMDLCEPQRSGRLL
jgi:hypothetical protein